MKSLAKASGQSETYEFARGYPPLAVFFTVVPALTILAIVLNLALVKMPLPLIGLLIVVAISCVVWVQSAITQIGDVTIECTPQELKVSRMFGGASYSWSFIDDIQLANPGPTLGDGGREEDGRVGLALFLRKEMPKGKKKQAETANPAPDAYLVCGSSDLAVKIVEAGQKIQKYQRRARGGASAPRVSGFNAPRKGFRNARKAATVQ